MGPPAGVDQARRRVAVAERCDRMLGDTSYPRLMDHDARLHALRAGNPAIDDPVTPITPDGRNLDVTVRCHTRRDSTEHSTHAMTIHTDGTVEVPHDIEVERIATALGSYSSCLELVDFGIPALRAALPLIARRARVALRRDARGRWRIPRDRAHRCCSTVAFPDPSLALEHLRSPVHAADFRARDIGPLARPIFDAAEAAWTAARPSGADPDRLVLDANGMDELWRAGIHPDDIPALAAPAAPVGGALPAVYFVRMRYGTVDPGWLTTVVAARPDAEFAAWLSARDDAAADAESWAAWLRHGVSPRDAEFAADRNLSPHAVTATAAATGWQPWLAARNVIAWAAAGCEPSPAHFAALARHGLEHHQPSAAAIDALVADLGVDGVVPTPDPLAELATPQGHQTDRRTDLGVMLALLGTRHEVRHQVRSGISSIDELPAIAS